MSRVPHHGLPLPEDALAVHLAEALGLSFDALRLRLLQDRRVTVSEDTPLDRKLSERALSLYGIEPVATDAPLPTLAEMAATMDLAPTAVIQAVHRKHRAFIPSNRPLTPDEAQLLRTTWSPPHPALPDFAFELIDLGARIKDIAALNREAALEEARQASRRTTTGPIGDSVAQESVPSSGPSAAMRAAATAGAGVRVVGTAAGTATDPSASWLVQGDAPAHGLPLPPDAKVRDLAELLGRQRYLYADELSPEEGTPVSASDSLTPELADRALERLGLQRVLSLAEREASCLMLLAIARSIGVLPQEVIQKVYARRARFIPSNRPLTPDELRLIEDVYPESGVALHWDEERARAEMVAEMAALRTELERHATEAAERHAAAAAGRRVEAVEGVARAEAEEASSSQVSPAPQPATIPRSAPAPAAPPALELPSSDDEGVPPLKTITDPVLRDYHIGRLHYWQLPDEVRANPEHAETIERIREHRNRWRGFAALLESDIERFCDVHCPPAHRQKIVDRYVDLPDRDPWLMLPLTGPDPDLAKRYLDMGDPGGILGSCVWTRRFPEPLRTRLATEGLELLLAHPERGRRHIAEGVYAALGEEAGAQLIDLDREVNPGKDAIAEGVGLAWPATEDSVFWKLLDYPRARPRRTLTQLIPPPGSTDRYGGTMLNPRVPVENRATLRDVVLPILLVDRDKEVRRRARIARAICDLPWSVIVPFDEPPFRALRKHVRRYQGLLSEGRGDEFAFEPAPEMGTYLEKLKKQLDDCIFDGAPLTRDLLLEALEVIRDPGRPAEHRDQVQALLLRPRALTSEILYEIAERGHDDPDLLWAVVHHRRKDRHVLRIALEAQPHDLGVLGAVVNSKEARDDEAIRALLLQTSEPHVLLTMARARVPGMAPRAMEALLDKDPVRALSLAEELGKAYRLEVTPAQWSRLLAHTSPQVRERAVRAMGRRDVRIGR